MDDGLIIADLLDGIPHPGETHKLVGHQKTVRQILDAHATGKLHHAILLSGPKGIGKATLAFRIAAHLFTHPNGNLAPSELDTPDPSNPVFSKIAAGAHPNLLHLSRPWDARAKKFKTQLTVDEIRRTVTFFGTARAEDGWRVAIVDAMDETNASAANALLKILEEPPLRTLFLVIAHSPASVLPTIRSRCLHLPMQGLGSKQLEEVLVQIGLKSEIAPDESDKLLDLSAGSARQAILLAREGGVELYNSFRKICEETDRMDWAGIHALADAICGRGKEDRYQLFFSFAEGYIEGHATGKTGFDNDISALARWAEVWEKTRDAKRLAEGYNLDRKQVVLNLFDDIANAAHS